MNFRRFLRNTISDPDTKASLKRLAERLGYDWSTWTRQVAYDACQARLMEIGPENLDVLEISPGDYWQQLPFKSFTEAAYPDFDICHDRLDQKFDLIICDQIFEHLLWPYQAAQNVRAMLNPGGWFMNLTPFLIRIHDGPNDCTRWTEQGMRHFLAETGFDLDRIETGSWGNRACVKANFDNWPHRGFFPSLLASLRNEPDVPVMVWAFAQNGPET